MSVVGNVDIFNSTFHWKIEKFSSIDAALGVEVLSPPFVTTYPREKKLRWQFVLYPGGYDEECREYMGLCLDYLSECEVSVTYTFTIIDEQHGKLAEFAPGKEFTHNKNRSWVMKKFGKRRLIHSLTNDTFIMSCTITVQNASLIDDNPYDADHSARVHFEHLLESGDMSDVTFEIENKQMRLHKAIVTSLSPVFFARLQRWQNSTKDGEEAVVTLQDVKYDVMKELFRYIYVRKVNDIENIADDLLVASDEFDVQGLKILCENVLSASLDADNALRYLELAAKHNANYLKSKAIGFIVNRLEEFVDKPEFEQMNGSYKDELLRSIARSRVKNV